MALFGGLPMKRESSVQTKVKSPGERAKRKGSRISGASGSLNELGTLFFFSYGGPPCRGGEA